MLKFINDETQQAIIDLLLHEASITHPVAKALENSYKTVEPEDLTTITRFASFSKKLLEWRETDSTIKLSMVRRQSPGHLANEFSFEITYTTGSNPLYGGFINHGTDDAPRWSSHT